MCLNLPSKNLYVRLVWPCCHRYSKQQTDFTGFQQANGFHSVMTINFSTPVVTIGRADDVVPRVEDDDSNSRWTALPINILASMPILEVYLVGHSDHHDVAIRPGSTGLRNI